MDKLNTSRLKALPGVMQPSYGGDGGGGGGGGSHGNQGKLKSTGRGSEDQEVEGEALAVGYTAIDHYRDDRIKVTCEKNFPAPAKLGLKKGAQVILLVNGSRVANGSGLVNGSRGVVVGFRSASSLYTNSSRSSMDSNNFVRSVTQNTQVRCKSRDATDPPPRIPQTPTAAHF